MALGGMMFGMYGAQRPFGGGDISHPAFIFAGLAVVGALILRFAGDRPLVSDRALIAGVVIGIAAICSASGSARNCSWFTKSANPGIGL